MLIVTDRPQAMQEIGEHLAPREPVWISGPVRKRFHEVGALWPAFSNGADASHLADSSESPFWSGLFLVDQAPESQFDQLRSLFCKPGAKPDPLACVALTGRNFHGHRQRTWSTERGNLHLSVAFSPDLPSAEFGLAMTMLPAVAVIDALGDSGAGAIAAGIKWVNDILVADRKVAGVLTATQSQRNRITAVVLGIGLNIAVAPAIKPTIFVPRTGCLQEVTGGRHLSLPVMLDALLLAIARRVDELHDKGPHPLVQAYREASLVIGRRVRVWEEEGTDETTAASDLPPPAATGTVTGIAADLGLTLAEAAGPIRHGRLAFETECRRLGI